MKNFPRCRGYTESYNEAPYFFKLVPRQRFQRASLASWCRVAIWMMAHLKNPYLSLFMSTYRFLSFRVFSRLVRGFPNSFVPLLGMKNSAFDGHLLALEEGMMSYCWRFLSPLWNYFQEALTSTVQQPQTIVPIFQIKTMRGWLVHSAAGAKRVRQKGKAYAASVVRWPRVCALTLENGKMETQVH